MNVNSSGERIRQVLEDREVPQAELARWADVGRAYVNAVVAGRSRPSDKIVSALREHLGVRPEWVLDGVGDPYVGVLTTPSGEHAQARHWPRPREVNTASTTRVGHTRILALLDTLRQEAGAMYVVESDVELHRLLDDALRNDKTGAARVVIENVLRGFLPSK